MQLKSLVATTFTYAVDNLSNSGFILEAGALLRWSVQSLMVGRWRRWQSNDDSKAEDGRQ
jgi:hypothetical protein